MKIIFILTLSIIYSINSFTQTPDKFKLGIEGGLVFSNISGKNLPLDKYNYKKGFSTGFVANYYFKKNLYIEMSIGFIRSGYISSYKTDSLVVLVPYAILTKSYLGSETKYDQDYFKNSYVLGYSIGSKLQFFIQAGGYWSYMLQNKLEATDFRFFDEEEYILVNDPAIPVGYSENKYSGKINSDSYNKIDIGIIIGCGLNYSLNDKMQLVIKPKFIQGLKNIQNFTNSILDSKYYNRIFNISLGIKMKM